MTHFEVFPCLYDYVLEACRLMNREYFDFTLITLSKAIKDSLEFEKMDILKPVLYLN